MNLLLNFLSEQDVIDINKRIDDGHPLADIGNSYPGLNRSQTSVLWDHLRKLKYPKSSRILGSKGEPYQDEEQIGVTPVYTWDELSQKEKKFYESKHTKHGKRTNKVD